MFCKKESGKWPRALVSAIVGDKQRIKYGSCRDLGAVKLHGLRTQLSHKPPFVLPVANHQ